MMMGLRFLASGEPHHASHALRLSALIEVGLRHGSARCAHTLLTPRRATTRRPRISRAIPASLARRRDISHGLCALCARARSMAVVGIDFGNLNCVLAQAERGGVKVLLNENSQRQNS